MRHKLSPTLAAVLAALAVPAAVWAGDVHIDAQDRAGTPSFAQLADGSWRISLSGVQVTLTATESKQFADLVKPDPAPTPDPSPTGSEGDVRPMRPLQSDMDTYVLGAVNGSTTNRTWLQRFERFRVYMNGLSWPADRMYAQDWPPPGWVYRDAMVAAYYPATTADEFHLWDKPPTDPSRKRLFVNFACNGTSCTQYAGDLGNPNFRARYINGVVAHAKAAGGLFVDDANFHMPRVVSNASGQFVRPWNPRTGTWMTDPEFADGMLALIREAKAQLPDPYEVVINTVAWHGPGILNIPQAKTALSVVDGWELEGNTVGQDTLPYKTQVDYAHQVGTFVVHDLQQATLPQTYTLASYLCMNGGHDFYGHPNMKPTLAWDPLWDRNLGAALTACVKGSDGIYRRQFERGFVTANPATRTGTVG